MLCFPRSHPPIPKWKCGLIRRGGSSLSAHPAASTGSIPAMPPSASSRPGSSAPAGCAPNFPDIFNCQDSAAGIQIANRICDSLGWYLGKRRCTGFFFSVNITVHRTVINKIALKVMGGRKSLWRKLKFQVQALYSYIYIYIWGCIYIYIYICNFFQNVLLGKLYQTHHCTMI